MHPTEEAGSRYPNNLLAVRLKWRIPGSLSLLFSGVRGMFHLFCFRPQSPALIRVKAKITRKLGKLIGDMLGNGLPSFCIHPFDTDTVIYTETRMMPSHQFSDHRYKFVLLDILTARDY